MKKIVLYSLLLLTVNQIKASGNKEIDKNSTPQTENGQRPGTPRPTTPYSQYPGNSPQAITAPTNTSSNSSEKENPEKFPGEK